MQLKRVNPTAYQDLQKARQNNVNPNEYLQSITSNFTPQQKKEWDKMMQKFY